MEIVNDDLVIKKVENAIFCPRGFASPTHDVVYDKDGQLVYESTVPRGETGRSHRTEATRASTKIGPSIARGTFLDDELLFLGTFDLPHFGHWLTEGISRFWSLLHEEEVPRVAWATSFNARLRRIRYSRFLAGAGPNHWRYALPAFNIKRDRLRSISRPTYVKALLVPSPSMKNRAQVHPIHLTVAQRIGLSVLSGRSIGRSDQPVFYSRTRLPSDKRRLEGEDRVEEYCRKKGALIVYSEKLSLAEQIEIVEKHDVFIGTVGSAFHALLFRNSKRPLKCVYLVPERKGGFPRNWELIDQAMGNQVENIVCCFSKDKKSKTGYINYSLATDALDKIL